MALTTIPNTPPTQRGTLDAMAAALRELQRERNTVVAGAAARARVAVAGIAVGDVVKQATYFRVSGGNIVAAADITAEATVTDGNVAFSTTDTTGGFVLLRYIDVA